MRPKTFVELGLGYSDRTIRRTLHHLSRAGILEKRDGYFVLGSRAKSMLALIRVNRMDLTGVRRFLVKDLGLVDDELLEFAKTLQFWSRRLS